MHIQHAPLEILDPPLQSVEVDGVPFERGPGAFESGPEFCDRW
jgi:hypothetical protein